MWSDPVMLAPPPPTARVAAPRPPTAPPPFHFPVIATVAPLVGSLVLFAITQSPFTLVFAALAPVIAVGSYADSRLGARRTARSEAARFDRDLAGAHTEVAARHDAERATWRERTPGAVAILGRPASDPYRWRSDPDGAVMVSLGSGECLSGVEVDLGAIVPDDLRSRLDELATDATTVTDAPVAVDAQLGIGLAGPRPLAEAALRALVVQLAWSLPPSDWWMSVTGLPRECEWLAALPHERRPSGGRSDRVDFGLVGQDTAALTVALASDRAQLPASCRVIVELGGGGPPAIVGHPDRSERRAFRAEAVTRLETLAWAPRLAEAAAREGLVSATATLPALVRLGSLLPESAGSVEPARGLAARFAVGAAGPVEVDLVEHGPHAIVGGTTGSGKSELLVAWVVAVAVRHSPDRVSFLLVDFKGGSAFAPLEQLPHTVGVITDLDEHGALRALESLRAELRFRERALAGARVRDVDGVPGMPRLVIVVDEFAAMLADHSDLHALFADLAARGRSLGIHLVLCTQRPAGVVRDAVLANADLRVSLRVNNRADSSAVIGTDAAAAIPASARGRALLSLAGEPAQPIQAALATEDDARAAATRWRDVPPPRRPWVEPLPPRVHLDDLAGVEPLAEPPDAAGDPHPIPFGLLDLPHEQRHAVAVWNPELHGNLLVLGTAGSGTSSALETLAAGAPTMWLPREVGAAWDVLGDVVAEVDGGVGGRRILVVDDLDALAARFPADHRTELLDRLARVLRDGPRHGLRVVLAAQRITGELQAVANLAPARLLLRHASRQDWVLAGAEGSTFIPSLPAGGGSWLGHRVQVAIGGAPRPPDSEARTVALDPARPIAVVTSRVPAVSARLTAVGYATVPLAALADPSEPFGGESRARTAIVGDVDEWQSRWGAIAALRPVAELVFDGCSPADLRVLTRSRELPPPIGRDQAWRLAADGAVERTVLPS